MAETTSGQCDYHCEAALTLPPIHGPTINRGMQAMPSFARFQNTIRTPTSQTLKSIISSFKLLSKHIKTSRWLLNTNLYHQIPNTHVQAQCQSQTGQGFFPGTLSLVPIHYPPVTQPAIEIHVSRLGTIMVADKSLQILLLHE